MSMPAVYFSHGQESGPWGTKIRAMAESVKSLGCRVESVDYQGIADPTDRVDKLIAQCRDASESLILVGSSMGGHVATAAAAAVNAAGLFVLAPAYYMPGHEDLTPAPPSIPIVIVHGWRDDVVPVENSIRFASQCRATLHLIDGDHRLTENIEEINGYLVRFVQNVAGQLKKGGSA
ncbi:MAG: alpha/beta hydrolase [Gammaproteobacteria bacterium]|nr:alpha/beta hydrolase [Gammaproteobacteria bacterium]MDH4316681.1 alpha/beta hydrolase [Gammaproteobacteria bacterium]MDH5215780.1 alpha/beta hydrolase [Gammaproteobacteria bacterium]